MKTVEQLPSVITIETALQAHMPNQVDDTPHQWLYHLQKKEDHLKKIHQQATARNMLPQELHQQINVAYVKILAQQKTIEQFNNFIKTSVENTMKNFVHAADTHEKIIIGEMQFSPLDFMEEELVIYSLPEAKAGARKEIEHAQKELIALHRRAQQNPENFAAQTTLVLKQYEKDFIRYIQGIRDTIKKDTITLQQNILDPLLHTLTSLLTTKHDISPDE
jgi:hypothetical protein